MYFKLKALSAKEDCGISWAISVVSWPLHTASGVIWTGNNGNTAVNRVFVITKKLKKKEIRHNSYRKLLSVNVGDENFMEILKKDLIKSRLRL